MGLNPQHIRILVLIIKIMISGILNGITCVRVYFYWESYERDKDAFCNDLKKIADEADDVDIQCIYDNHQWNCSSRLGYGAGMPNSTLSNYDNKIEVCHDAPITKHLKEFWKQWWNGKDCWEAQLDYIKFIVKLLNQRKSTHGFEVLNEPPVYNVRDYSKVGKYHKYMFKEIRKITDKPLFFCAAQPAQKYRKFLYYPLLIDLILHKQICPINKEDKIIYDAHMYPPVTSSHIPFWMTYFKHIANSMKLPIYVGEFNSGIGEKTELREHQIKQYIQLFKEFKVYGWAVWRWSYRGGNLAKVVNDHIEPTDGFTSLARAICDLNP